jgi:hypothetical protein
VLKLIPAGEDGEIAKLAMVPPVELIVNPVAAVLTVRVSEEDDSVNAGAAKAAETIKLLHVLPTAPNPVAPEEILATAPAFTLPNVKLDVDGALPKNVTVSNWEAK